MMRSAVVNHRLGIAETRWINRALGSSLHLNPDSGLSVIDRWSIALRVSFAVGESERACGGAGLSEFSTVTLA